MLAATFAFNPTTWYLIDIRRKYPTQDRHCCVHHKGNFINTVQYANCVIDLNKMVYIKDRETGYNGTISGRILKSISKNSKVVSKDEVVKMIVNYYYPNKRGLSNEI